MRFKILIAVLALSLPLAACETPGEPPSGQIIGGICRGGTFAMDGATVLKPNLGMMTVAVIDEAAGYVNQFCSSADVPTVTQAIVTAITIAIAKFLPSPLAQVATPPQGAVEIVIWPPIRDGWNAAYGRWKSA